MANNKGTMAYYKREKKRIARDFGYDKKYIARIENAKSVAELEIIMISARQDKFGE